MSGVKGNSGGKRARSGRKSAYAERANAELLAGMFFEETDKEEIEKLMATGKFSVKDSFLSKALSGGEKQQLAIFNKLFPDNLKLSGGLQIKPTPILKKIGKDVQRNNGITANLTPKQTD